MSLNSSRDFVTDVFSKIQEEGGFFSEVVSEKSVFQGAFKELLNYSAQIENPSERVIESPNFNIGFAVARFMYLLRGINTLDEIAFYAPKSADYSDDGKHLFGSAYGYKIFKENRFWKMVEKLKTTKSSKRLYFPIFDESDFLRDSKDIPCAVGFLLLPRENILNTTLIMRANDAYRLLPYNIFEFSLLQECLAIASGMQLGNLGYFAGTIHLRGDDISIDKNPWGDAKSFAMNSMIEFNQSLYKTILEKEENLRKALPTIGDGYVAFVDELTEGLDDFWKEIFYVLADYGYSKCYKKHPQIIKTDSLLYSLYRTSIPPQFL